MEIVNNRHQEPALRSKVISILFWLHFIIVFLPILLFLVPLSLWAGRAVFQFWYMISILGIEAIWAIFLYPKIRKIGLICPLTSVMQYTRGYPISDVRNHHHSFIAELLEKYGVRANFKRVNIMMLLFSVIVILQYVFLKMF